ncbi:hypothetical protein HNO92_003957 [Chromobacterium alkanivorans]|uniref:hypothetical protein n=1 Tax=Chromobacterium TaxID=535 RepID=UPI0006533ACA|nr:MULTISPECIES: hypothetical protein [Chromobacterium]KMN81489.1 hypothetical protein VK98_13465 [Chromobacterium sp. LK11]MCS3803907.1 hypothetical protein [Chromobacterium alkanivorans]MCS3817988.1 hypothetical protein [Chromobacterium alkanivorans]MCS3875608.1 hypothetical protein [Chromobacterium alkanivorans]
MSLQERLHRFRALRHTGHGGEHIALHRAMRTEPFRRLRWLEIIGLPLLFNLLLLKFLPETLALWRQITQWSIEATGVPAQLSSLQVLNGLTPGLWLPWLDLPASVPSFWQWWGNGLIGLLLLSLSFLISPESMPARYLLRLFVIIQSSSCVYFALLPAAFNHSLPEYHSSCLTFVLILLFLMPWVHALTFHVLEKPVWHKLALSGVSLAYLLLEAPLHYFAAALALHYGSLLFMPLLFILGSLMVEVMMMIALYAWAMSWEEGLPIGFGSARRPKPEI